MLSKIRLIVVVIGLLICGGVGAQVPDAAVEPSRKAALPRAGKIQWPASYVRNIVPDLKQIRITTIIEPIPERQLIIDDLGKYLIGRGYSTFKDQLKSTNCIASFKTNPTTYNTKAIYRTRRITTQKEMESELQITTAMKMGLGGLGATLAGSLYQSEKVSSFFMHLLVEVELFTVGVEMVQHGRAFRDYNPLRDPESFYSACGDSYVSRVFLGGRFRGLLTFSAFSREARKDMSARLGLASGDTTSENEFREKLRTAIASDTCTITSVTEGVASFPPSHNCNEQAIYDFAIKTFPEQVLRTGGNVVLIETADHAEINRAGMHRRLQSVVEQKHWMNDMGLEHGKAAVAAADFKVAYENPSHFDGSENVTLPLFNASTSLLSDFQKKLRYGVDFCVDNIVAHCSGEVPLFSAFALGHSMRVPAPVIIKEVDVLNGGWNLMFRVPRDEEVEVLFTGRWRLKGDSDWQMPTQDPGMLYFINETEGGMQDSPWNMRYVRPFKVKGPAAILAKVIDWGTSPGYTDNQAMPGDPLRAIIRYVNPDLK